MKTTKTVSKLLKNRSAILSVLFALTLLAGCGGKNARMDMMQAKANGSIEITYTISAEELYQILSKHFGKVDVKFIDTKYALPDNGKVVELSRSNSNGVDSDALTRKAGWDCDDYAIAAMVPLRNYAFGTMFMKTAKGTRHAINVFVNIHKEVVYWEPQTREYYHGQFHKPDLIIF